MSAVATIVDQTPPLSLDEARAYCRKLATTHYENFSVVSRLVPRRLRPHFHAIYAYCRGADDLADETADPSRALMLLDEWERQLKACYDGRAIHPVFVALADTVRTFDLPLEPFTDLLTAFRRDQQQVRYETIEELLDYCRCSANPVGRLVLHLAGGATPENFALSDSICTGLQLVNFCQDVARDYDRGRIYLPIESWRKFGYDEAMFARRESNPAFADILCAETSRAERYLLSGMPLAQQAPREIRPQIELFIRGGLEVVAAIRRIDYNVWHTRPMVSRFRKLRLLASAWWRGPPPALRMSPDLETSYRHCQHLARQAASSFYLAFWLLPRGKRRSMHALYAFLRRGDDLADNDAPLPIRRAAVQQWRESLDLALAGEYHDPMWPAVHDTVKRHSIPHEYLYAAIDGVQMDLEGRKYQSFADLETYLDRVASVVGLSCLHVWGAELPAAVGPARQCGHAYQMTNILRDLSEDLSAGRLYLPLEDLDRFGCSERDLTRRPLGKNVSDLLRFEIERTRELYKASEELKPLLSRDGRRIFAAMTATYRALLDRIERLGLDVLRRRPAIPKWRKLVAVGRGWCG